MPGQHGHSSSPASRKIENDTVPTCANKNINRRVSDLQCYLHKMLHSAIFWAPSIDRHWRDSLCLAAFPCFGLTEFNLTPLNTNILEHIKISLQMFPCFKLFNIQHHPTIELNTERYLKSISIKLSQVVTDIHGLKGHLTHLRHHALFSGSGIAADMLQRLPPCPAAQNCHRWRSPAGRPRKIASLILFLSFCHWYSVTFRASWYHLIM